MNERPRSLPLPRRDNIVIISGRAAKCTKRVPNLTSPLNPVASETPPRQWQRHGPITRLGRHTRAMPKMNVRLPSSCSQAPLSDFALTTGRIPCRPPACQLFAPCPFLSSGFILVHTLRFLPPSNPNSPRAILSISSEHAHSDMCQPEFPRVLGTWAGWLAEEGQGGRDRGWIGFLPLPPRK